MSLADKPQEPWISSLHGWLLGCALIGLILGLNWLLPALFHFSRKTLSASLRLERNSIRWPLLKRFCLPVKWLAATVFLVVTGLVLIKPVASTSLLLEAAYLLVGLLSGLIFSTLHWLEQNYNDSHIKKIQAGHSAERYVQKIIEAAALRYPGSRSLHGVLFVFNVGKAQEFSAEADHILMTQNQLYLIETNSNLARSTTIPKRRNGKPSAHRAACAMHCNTAHGLNRKVHLPCPTVPIMVINGREIRIVDGPANVVNVVDLIKLLDAFELARQQGPIKPDEVATQLVHLPLPNLAHWQGISNAPSRLDCGPTQNYRSIRVPALTAVVSGYFHTSNCKDEIMKKQHLSPLPGVAGSGIANFLPIRFRLAGFLRRNGRHLFAERIPAAGYVADCDLSLGS